MSHSHSKHGKHSNRESWLIGAGIEETWHRISLKFVTIWCILEGSWLIWTTAVFLSHFPFNLSQWHTQWSGPPEQGLKCCTLSVPGTGGLGACFPHILSMIRVLFYPKPTLLFADNGGPVETGSLHRFSSSTSIKEAASLIWDLSI